VIGVPTIAMPATSLAAGATRSRASTAAPDRTTDAFGQDSRQRACTATFDDARGDDHSILSAVPAHRRARLAAAPTLHPKERGR